MIKILSSVFLITCALIVQYRFILYICEQPRYFKDYRVISKKQASNNSWISYSLELDQNESKNFWVLPKSLVIKNLGFIVYYMTDEILDIKIIDLEEPRFEIPNTYPFPRFIHGPKSNPKSHLLEVIVNEFPFYFTIKRKSTNEILFSSKGYRFIYTDKYLEFTTTIPTKNLYGFGERNYNFTLKNGTFTLFNKDQPTNIENGESGHNLYGSHPVCLIREKSSNYSMVYLRNSNAMDIVINNSVSITYKILGGIFDFIYFVGNDNPEASIKMYHDYIKGWILHPLWAFGFHQSRWGYRNIQELTSVVDNYAINDLSLDAIWSDIDYMINYTDFIIDHIRFPPQQLQDLILKSGKKWIPIIDAGISIRYSEYFFKGVEKNVFIKNPDGTFYRGILWPGPVYFPDFFNPNTSEWWQEGLDLLYSSVKFSGIWLDMNEASNFGYAPILDKKLYPDEYFSNLPYKLINMYDGFIKLDSIHYNNISEYDVHNFFGFFECKSTYEYLLKISNLTFILSRSTVPGSGQFTAHWLGDNEASWDYLRFSIAGSMNFNMFGIPMIGADICGYLGSVTPELCARWMQLGAFYPFSRNHAEHNSKLHEPYNLGKDVLETSRLALKLRYSLIKYYYSLFIEKNGTGTIFRPVFFEFPHDEILLDLNSNYTEYQFLIGSYLMVSPIVSQGHQGKMTYFPKATWYDFITGKKIQDSNDAPQTLYIEAPLRAYIPVFIREGGIIHQQNVEKVLATSDLNNRYILIVALSANSGKYTASGKIISLSNFTDENIVMKCKQGNCLMDIFVEFNINSNNNTIESTIKLIAEDPNNQLEPIYLTEIHYYGTSHLKYNPILKDLKVFHNKIMIEYAFVDNHKYGKDCIVAYLTNILIRNEDIIKIRKI